MGIYGAVQWLPEEDEMERETSTVSMKFLW